MVSPPAEPCRRSEGASRVVAPFGQGQQQISRLWIASLVKPNVERVPMDDVRLGTPSLSADGARIAVPAYEPDPIRPFAHLVVMHRDGSNRRTVTTGDELVSQPRWAPHGTRLAYMSQVGRQPDSAAIYLIDAANPGPGTRFGTGNLAAWLDDSSIVITRRGDVMRLSLNTGRMESLSHDSVAVVPFAGRGFDLVIDGRAARSGIFLRTRATDGTLRTHFLTRVGPDLQETPLRGRFRSAPRRLRPAGAVAKW